MNSTTSHPQIDLRLIENALALTGRTMEDMEEIRQGYVVQKFFSYPKFFYYLLSPEFIGKYHRRYTDNPSWDNEVTYTARRFGSAIYEYQLYQSKSLEYLLSKI